MRVLVSWGGRGWLLLYIYAHIHAVAAALADISDRVPVIEEDWPRDLLESYSCPQCIHPISHYFDADSLNSTATIS